MKIGDGYILRKVADRYVIIPLGGDDLTHQDIYTINESGAFLFERLKAKDCSEEELVAALAEEYEVPEETVRGDVQAFVSMLSGIGALTQ